ncbi:uncharacterized protein LOC126844420 [Adelges cooleyi]|uniref:uncharacterized protein LOC126844420 n=1 Tax=Adelges cooleyi TaxID=133065 RepID=UPI00217FC7DF|nr:uncharacterized protein LOC126844420 [Adelges cooleyi]
MHSNSKYSASVAILVLTLCVLDTHQTIFSKKKPAPTTVDVNGQVTAPIPQKEHWWQVKYMAEQSGETAGTSHVAVAVPLANLHHKLQSVLESHHNSEVKWVPCLCPVKKGEHPHASLFHHHAAAAPVAPPTQAPPVSINSAPRYIVANYQIEP